MLLNLSLRLHAARDPDLDLSWKHTQGAGPPAAASGARAAHARLHYIWLMQHRWKPQTSKNVTASQKWVGWFFSFPPHLNGGEDCNNYGVTSARTMGPLIPLAAGGSEAWRGESRTGLRCRANPTAESTALFADISTDSDRTVEVAAARSCCCCQAHMWRHVQSCYAYCRSCRFRQPALVSGTHAVKILKWLCFCIHLFLSRNHLTDFDETWKTAAVRVREELISFRCRSRFPFSNIVPWFLQ